MLTGSGIYQTFIRDKMLCNDGFLIQVHCPNKCIFAENRDVIIFIYSLLEIVTCYGLGMRLIVDSHDLGLRTPNEAFFHQNPELLGLGRQIGQINSGAFGVFSAELSAPILVQL